MDHVTDEGDFLGFGVCADGLVTDVSNVETSLVIDSAKYFVLAEAL